MIQANELRIGNLVTDEWYESFKTVITVDSINSKGIDLFIEDDGNWTELAKTWIDAEIPFEKLRGIPLTEEWLIKSGFTNGNIDFVNDSFGVYSIDEDSFIFCRNNECLTSIQYVHQLQNLYFALTSEELTIKETV